MVIVLNIKHLVFCFYYSTLWFWLVQNNSFTNGTIVTAAGFLRAWVFFLSDSSPFPTSLIMLNLCYKLAAGILKTQNYAETTTQRV